MRMCSRFVLVWLGVLAAFALGLTACAAPAATTLPTTPILSADKTAQIILTSPVIAGNNLITVQLRDAQTGEPFHDATVRVAVAAKKQQSSAKDADHNTAPKDDHASEKKASHANDKQDSHEIAKTPTRAPAPDAHGTAKKDDHTDEKKDAPSADAKNASHADDDDGHTGKPLVAGTHQGEYIGQVMIPNAGEWLLTITAQAAGAEQTTRFTVNATRSAETWLVLGGFLGVNLAVIATAGMTKRKPLKK